MPEDNRFDIPILLIFFTRLNTTKQTFAKIREQKPKKLYLGSDGPRSNSTDGEKIAAVRSWILEHIDWDCEVVKFFNERNLGTKYGVGGHIKRFFEAENMGIVLEDDCLPDSSFFGYCRELLYKYEFDERVGAISGNNYSFGVHDRTNSYYFSEFCSAWGWASWKRAFKNYDIEVKNWPEVKKNPLFAKAFHTWKEYDYYCRALDAVYSGKIMTWDYQMILMHKINRRCMIVPTQNLVTNIGFNTEDAVYCSNKENDPFDNVPSETMELPLRHPQDFFIDYDKDRLMIDKCCKISRFKRIRRSIIQVKLKKNKKIVRILGKTLLDSEN